MADFLLVHGSCHGAWCWDDLIPHLRALGHTARAIDLPTHGADQTPIHDATLDGCADAVLSALTGPTILVGHSWGGFPITAAAERDNSLMSRLVYLCAYVPRDGMSLITMRDLWPHQPLARAARKSADGLSYTVPKSAAMACFYQDCAPDAAARAVTNLCPQAIVPQATPLAVTSASAALPRSYIRCTRDGTIMPDFQSEMARDFAPSDIHQFDSGHSPFLAKPADLATLLNQIAKAT